jgi:AbrB family looped-hinge helix DNA binding protein
MTTNQSNCCNNVCNFQIESVVRFDDRGQFVLPKDLREKADIEAGDKLAVISCEDENGEVCCLTVMKSDKLQGMVKDFLGPMFKEIVEDSTD